MTNEELVEQIRRFISEHENTAEEYFQEIGDEGKGNEYLAKADSLRELLNWMNEQRKNPLRNKATGNLKTNDVI